MLVSIVATALLATALCSSASAHHWTCEYCGFGHESENMPLPGNSCTQNTKGKSHSWVLDDDDDGRSHHWTCVYCGRGSSSVHMPHPGKSCTMNPDGGKYHKWVKD